MNFSNQFWSRIGTQVSRAMSQRSLPEVVCPRWPTPHDSEEITGGSGGIDVFRRIIARRIAKQCAVAGEKATAPFQYALRTRAGCECVSHVLQTLIDVDPTTTILSLDGVELSTLSHAMPC